MIGSVRTIDPRGFQGLAVVKVDLDGFLVKVHFDGSNRLDIDDYWELLDEKNVLIDRNLDAKYRKEFKLPSLVGAKLVKVEKILESFYLHFDKGVYLNISSPDFEFLTLNQYKPFGDNQAGRGR